MTNSYYEIRNIKEIKNFDPYEILDITTSDELPAIKKSYRNLTLKYHPDKN